MPSFACWKTYSKIVRFKLESKFIDKSATQKRDTNRGLRNPGLSLQLNLETQAHYSSTGWQTLTIS